jgi:hypothetical protein
LYLNACASLEIVQVLATSANKSTMLCGWNLYSQNNAVPESNNELLQFCLELVYKLGFTSKTNFIRGFTLARTVDSSGHHEMQE